MIKVKIGVIGATSLVGRFLLEKLSQNNYEVIAYSRQERQHSNENVTWKNLTPVPQVQPGHSEQITLWVCAAPIWILAEHFSLLESSGIKRIIILSSTSCLTKSDSTDSMERELAEKLSNAEKILQSWADEQGVDCVILRPTLIYGSKDDKNVSVIARFIRRFGFFPVMGQANGLRQPIHVDDVADACVSALQHSGLRSCTYNISGGEILTYREMVSRIFIALGKKPRIFSVPLFVFRVLILFFKAIPKYRHWSPAMAERMNKDLVFDHSDASHDFGFDPRGFKPDSKELMP